MSWSPNGREIVFSDVVSSGISTLIVVNNDGSNRRILTSGFHPAWSPDGTKILFIMRDGGFRRLSTIQPDGTGIQNIPLSLPVSYSLSTLPLTWSPDGRKIAFVSGDSTNAQLRIIDADGSNPQIFIDECGSFAPNGCGIVALSPAWSPNGRTIALVFSSQIAVKNIGNEAITTLTNTSGININPNWQPLAKAMPDFDGDGRADISVFRPSDNIWYLNRSQAGFSATQFGLSTDKITPADFDGDGKTDIAVYRDGFWYWLDSSNGSFHAAHFGQTGDIPVPADFTGDGRAEIAIFRKGFWYSLDLSNNQLKGLKFGIFSDKPVAADYDGEGKTDFAIYRSGTWFILHSSNGQFTTRQFGASGDIPIAGVNVQ